MDKEKCYYELNLRCQNILNKNWKFPSTENLNRSGMFNPFTREVFDSVWLKYLECLGFHLQKKTLLFYKKPYQKEITAHIDIYDSQEYAVCGINYVVGGEDSHMIWYKEPEIKRPLEITAVRSVFKSFTVNNLKEIERFNINRKITLVKTGIPHSILCGSKERWCFSLRFVQGQFNDWDKVVDFMRSKNLLIER